MTRNRCGKVIVIGIGEEERFPLRERRSSIAPVGEALLLRGNMFDDVVFRKTCIHRHRISVAKQLDDNTTVDGAVLLRLVRRRHALLQ